MCGIFTVFSKKNNPLNHSKCFKALNELHNRGPDLKKYNYFLNKRLFISNSILSITGKPDKKNDLFKSKSKNYSISFNGEIYNYETLKIKYLNLGYIKKDKDFTDTEILINLYDVLNESKIPEKINGMFAYVIFDQKSKKLIISNDVQGEKNLYYYEDEKFFIVASTPKSIIKFLDKTSLNINTLKSYFATRHYMPLENTCFKNIKLFQNGVIANYDTKKKSLVKKIYENPLNWINENEYNYYNKLKKHDLVELLEHKLVNQAKLMIPTKRFGSIVSGGIDSSLQTAILSKIKKPNVNLSINHNLKDKIIYENKNFFEKYLKKKILVFNSNNNIYKRNAQKVYDIISSPMQTHDLPSRMQLSQEFKKKNCKVFFSADGCDELFGGQQIYLKVFSNKLKNYDQNNSPYSSLIDLDLEFESFDNEKNRNFFDTRWLEVMDHYDFLNSKEQNIQSSLYLDYFIQSINVANRSNDLICCNFSVEPRNIFIQKDILKMIINLPLKYKYDVNNQNRKFIQKNILKDIFIRYFDKNLIKVKEGFSGYPNQLKNELYHSNFKYVKEFLGIKKIKKKITNALEWKLINLEIFLEKYIKNEY